MATRRTNGTIVKAPSVTVTLVMVKEAPNTIRYVEENDGQTMRYPTYVSKSAADQLGGHMPERITVTITPA